MDISNNGIELIKKYEGLRLTAYLCPAGVLTIGYGHTKNVKKGDKISEETAEKYLKEDVQKYVDHVNYYINTYGYKFNQNEFDALVSFAFNIGTLRGITNGGRRTNYQIAQKFKSYVFAGGVKLSGLVKRRAAEYDLFISPVEEVAEAAPEFKVGKIYTTLVSLKVRKGPDIKYDLVGYNGLTAGAKKHDSNKNGCLDAGTRVTCKEVCTDSDGNIWLRIPSGYIAAIYKENKYIK